MQASNFQSIDQVLISHGLIRLKKFHYSLGDGLFYALAVPVYFRFTSIEIRQGIEITLGQDWIS